MHVNPLGLFILAALDIVLNNGALGGEKALAALAQEKRLHGVLIQDSYWWPQEGSICSLVKPKKAGIWQEFNSSDFICLGGWCFLVPPGGCNVKNLNALLWEAHRHFHPVHKTKQDILST